MKRCDVFLLKSNFYGTVATRPDTCHLKLRVFALHGFSQVWPTGQLLGIQLNMGILGPHSRSTESNCGGGIGPGNLPFNTSSGNFHAF